MSMWIDVNERLPEKYGAYIVCSVEEGKAEVFQAYYNDNKDAEIFGFFIYDDYPDKWGEYCCDETPVNNVTHWMPFPEPPTDLLKSITQVTEESI